MLHSWRGRGSLSAPLLPVNRSKKPRTKPGVTAEAGLTLTCGSARRPVTRALMAKSPCPFPQHEIAHDGHLAKHRVDPIQRDDRPLHVHTAGGDIDAARGGEAQGPTVRTQLSERDHLVGQGGIAQQLRKRQAIAAQRLEESRERRRRQEPGEDRRTLDGKVLDLDRPLQRSIWAWCCRLFGR
jgi:hypothetical protein